MGHNHKPKAEEEEGGESAPLWMISFADMMSLLMAFFVMLSTFSDFGPAETSKLQETVDAMLAPVTYTPGRPTMRTGTQTVGSGPFLKSSETRMQNQNQYKKPLSAYKARKIFLADSRKMFWGSGVALSGDGQSLLDTVAAFANRASDRIIISEHGPNGDRDLGVLRAISVVEYLTDSGISRNRCNISAESMRPDEDFANSRKLEIVLLDESLYK